MSFSIASIKYKIGEVAVPVSEICETTGRNYARLLQRSGFEYVHRTKKSEEIFFGEFINQELVVSRADFIIFVNQSMPSLIPGKIPGLFANRSDVNSVGFLEISDGCTGFSRALVVANAMMESNLSSRVHIICGEKYSKFYEDHDESVSPIFSDAISLTTLTKEGPYKIIGFKFLNFFSMSNSISVSKDNEGSDKIRMDGARVLTWATSEIPMLVNELLSEAGLSAEFVNSWFLHQGSKVVVESLSEKFGIDLCDNFNSSQLGNTVSSTIPIMIKESLIKSGRNSIERGHAIVLGFGIGLSVVALLLEINS